MPESLIQPKADLHSRRTCEWNGWTFDHGLHIQHILRDNPGYHWMRRYHDDIHWAGFTAAHTGSIDLLRNHAIFAGLSTGAAYLAATAPSEPAGR